MKRILTVAGSDSGGGAGIQADLKTIALLGGYGMSVVTALTAQNTVGVHGVHEVPVPFIEQQFDAVISDIGVDAAKTGMLSSPEIVKLAAKKIREYQIEKLVVDPVMVAKGGDPLLSEQARETLRKELIPLAYIVTPNLPEAEVLTGKKVRTLKEMNEAAERIHDMGASYVLIKGGHLKGEAVDILYDGKETAIFSDARVPTKNTHGTGCTYSSAIATLIADTIDVHGAVGKAKAFITEAIVNGLPIGKGHGPTNPHAQFAREVERYKALKAMGAALDELGRSKVGHLVPEVRSNLGYALPFARGAEDVLAVSGRITEIGGRMVPASGPVFGVSRHIARIVLTAMAHDSSFRCAMNIRYSSQIISACRRLNLRIASFDRGQEPKGVKEMEGSSLEWGTKRVLDDLEDVPDVIYDEGDQGKEPMVRILGKNPEEVIAKVLAIGKGC
jgi:hydroxymethylpyrimidine/phosphomethylpyrimidine kinase